MSEKCRNNNSGNPLTSRRTDGGENHMLEYALKNLDLLLSSVRFWAREARMI